MTDTQKPYLVLDAWGKPVYDKIYKDLADDKEFMDKWSRKVVPGKPVEFPQDTLTIDWDKALNTVPVPNAKETFSRDEKSTVYLEYNSEELDGQFARFIFSNIFLNLAKPVTVRVGISLRHPKDAFDRKVGNAVAKKDAVGITFTPDPTCFQIASTEEGTVEAAMTFFGPEGQVLALSWGYQYNDDGTIDFRSSPQIVSYSYPSTDEYQAFSFINPEFA